MERAHIRVDLFYAQITPKTQRKFAHYTCLLHSKNITRFWATVAILESS